MSIATKVILKKISDNKILIRRYYSSGQLKYKGHLNEMPKELRDKLNGTEIVLKYYDTKNGSKDGLASWWHENGQKRHEVTFKDGKQDGKGTAWYESGQIESDK